MEQGSRSEVQGSREKLRVAVVGAGAFGRNHLRVYRELAQALLKHWKTGKPLPTFALDV